MQLAVNYSLPLARLIKDGSVQVDLIKCPDWEGMLEEASLYGPITIHFDLKAGLGSIFEIDFERIKGFKEKTATPHINTHLVAPPNFDPADAIERSKLNTLWREEISRMTDYFDSKGVALEHFPFTEKTPHLRYATDSQVFTNVIVDTNCMLLLDLAHARITANTLGIDVKEYISNLPLDRLVEMHITGVRFYNGVLEDHFELDEEDWVLFDWALNQIRSGVWRKPEMLAFEYGGIGEVFVWRTNQAVLREQVPRLYQAVHAV
ncbi:MAG: DUF692 family protein [Brevefilum sp.]|nr:DUF692 family protein [Brevefilum sp.]MDT8382600.1 DUF692 family protein [Brevefilum sp.]MDW7754770.1 DUF692 family protein [Brevefilum sp.]